MDKTINSKDIASTSFLFQKILFQTLKTNNLGSLRYLSHLLIMNTYKKGKQYEKKSLRIEPKLIKKIINLW